MEQNNLQSTDNPAEDSSRSQSQVAEREPDPLDEIITKEDAITLLRNEMRNWPHQEREVFEMYYVEGLEPEEIGMDTGYSLNEVQERLASVRHKLHEIYVTK